MFTVLMNGNKFAEFPTKEQAEEYAMMQRCKIRAAGLAKTPSAVPDQKRSFAAQQTWIVKEG